MKQNVVVKVLPSADCATVVDAFYAQEGKPHHRARPDDLFFAAFIDEKIVGVCRFCVEDKGTPLLRSMIVHEPLRAQKIGAAILKSFAEHLNKNGIGPTYCIPYDHLERFYGLIDFKVIPESEAPLFLQERIKEYRIKSPDAFMIMKRD